jgi:hypothetical protein
MLFILTPESWLLNPALPHLPHTAYNLSPLFSTTFPLSDSISFVFKHIPASLAAFRARSFVFNNIRALVLHF